MKKGSKFLKVANVLLLLINMYMLFKAFIWPGVWYEKPMLYLYPTENEVISVKLENDNLIRSSYPKYNDGWVVNASLDGNLKIGNKNYYGLFWDEINNNYVDFKEGFYVDKDNSINFLEEKLSFIGLSEREANEFITYWLPTLENNKKNLVYFELTRERDKNNKLIISPEPDTVIRVIMHVKKVNRKVNIKEQKLEHFERKGFTVVEWGGVRY